MAYPVAMIPYTNMAPYRELGPPEGCRFVSCVPSASIEALIRGRVMAAAVPVGGLSAVASETEMLGPFGIAARERSMSVLLFSKTPFRELAAGADFRLTAESASSVRLLQLLFGYRNGSSRISAPAGDGRGGDGELLIGDAALLKMKAHREGKVPEFPWVTDLAGEWFAVHGLPFVFARWVVRKDAPAACRRKLRAWLAVFREREPELVRRAAPRAAKRLGLPVAEILDYFSVIRRVLDDTDMAGQKRFLFDFQQYMERMASLDKTD